MKLATNTRKGMSLPELIAVIIVIAIIGGIALNVISGLSTEAKNAKGKANVAELNRVVANIKAAGGSVGSGGTHVDTDDVGDAIDALKLGVTLNNVKFNIDPNFTYTEASYGLSADGVFSFTLGQEP